MSRAGALLGALLAGRFSPLPAAVLRQHRPLAHGLSAVLPGARGWYSSASNRWGRRLPFQEVIRTHCPRRIRKRLRTPIADGGHCTAGARLATGCLLSVRARAQLRVLRLERQIGRFLDPGEHRRLGPAF
jgi:hypothetical protein